MYALSRVMFVRESNYRVVRLRGETLEDVKRQAWSELVFFAKRLGWYVVIGCLVFWYFNEHWGGSASTRWMMNLVLFLVFVLSDADEDFVGLAKWTYVLCRFKHVVKLVQ